MWSSRALGGVAVVALTAFAGNAAAEDASGAPVSAPAAVSAPPPAARSARSEGSILAATGATVFTLAYLASTLGATSGYDSPSSSDTARGALWIPAVGPFILVGKTRPGGLATLYALDGVVQVASLATFVEGLVIRHAASTAAAPPPRSAARWTLTMAPELSATAAGAVILGTF